MKFIENVLYLEFCDLVESGISENTIKWSKQNTSKGWNFTDDPADKRKVLIQYETLPEKYKKAILNRFIDPYDYVVKTPIREFVQPDVKAEEFFRQYRLADHKPLPEEYQKKYTVAASWLNALIEAERSKKDLKRRLPGITIAKFWEYVAQIIQTDKIELPCSYRRLREKLNSYKTDGYECLIDWRFGNKLAAKIGKEETDFNPELAEKQIALIRKAKTLHNNYDAMQITKAVNLIFKKQGWSTISHSTVKNIIKENEHITTPGSRGIRTYNNTIAMQVKRSRPEYPLYYCTLDGWTVELLYQDEKGFNNRLVVVVVLDAFNNYPVGYAIGERECAELIKEANRNAIIHLQQMFGKPYRPMQLQSDRYALKALTPFYQAMAHIHTPAAVGNAKAKVIEPYFKYLNKTYCQYFPNWSGHNITASKKNQPNTEFLNKIKHSFPDKEGVINQIDMIMHQERKSKLDAYLAQWQAIPEDQKMLLQKMDYIMIFGKPHTHLNSIIGQGVVATFKGEEHTFDSFDPAFRAHQHLKWQLFYDEHDTTNVVAVSEDNKLRFLLSKKRVIPMDIHSTTPEDHAYLKQIRDFNKDRKEEIINTYINDDALVQDVISSTPFELDDYNESVLKLMFTHKGQQKDSLQAAKGLKQAKQKVLKQQLKQQHMEAAEEDNQWNDIQMQYLQDKTDFNQYLD